MARQSKMQDERNLITKRVIELKLNKASGTAVTLDSLKDELGLNRDKEKNSRVQRNPSS
ncbi:hypothetical protein VIBNISO65_680016 [Vibrio nigripulchritudo SO65]|nr:hypothetical protein VIBNIAM115_1530017 [Vibrio nigripulchritudo AM115]CCN40605.1 hypothetical protein VIBNIFTn2_1340068 [Vibrio nigripulchritudo FTn2]CCN66102.1 hypothetical protein VIBNIPon4_50017 [Vibrio nigripulchritudo POn4]CCN78592.1 hypothetical protein VIBNISO65_680016 [Vibrio nigripulchritudo SO65]